MSAVTTGVVSARAGSTVNRRSHSRSTLTWGSGSGSWARSGEELWSRYHSWSQSRTGLQPASWTRSRLRGWSRSGTH